MEHPSATLSPTQRRITLLRHARAVADETGDDHARPLAPDGRDAAMELGQWLQDNAMLPELVICSTATRTRETLAALPPNLPTHLAARAYLASAGELFALLQEIDDAVRHVMLIGHNPGMHELVALLAGDYVREADAQQLIGHYPTCGLVSMTALASVWAQLSPVTATVDLLRFATRE